jgi:hypothetical protein
MGQVLDEQDVPETGRWLVIPSWMAALIKNSDLKQAYLTGDSQSPLRNGKLGMIDRFTLYVSNNLPYATDLGSDSSTGGTGTAADVRGWNILAGTRDAISFASQMTNVETIRAQSTFGNIVRGLNVYGSIYATHKPANFMLTIDPCLSLDTTQSMRMIHEIRRSRRRTLRSMSLRWGLGTLSVECMRLAE